MKFCRFSWPVVLPSLLLWAGAWIPFGGIPIVRWTLYAFLAYPLAPLIRRLGWVYRDKPIFLTPAAAMLTAVVWAIGLYLLLCTLRYVRYRSHHSTQTI
jgi:hypothetical protein